MCMCVYDCWCMCVGLYVWVEVVMHIGLYRCMCMFVSTGACVHVLHVGMYVPMYLRVYAKLGVCVVVCVCARVCVCMHV